VGTVVSRGAGIVRKDSRKMMRRGRVEIVLDRITEFSGLTKFILFIL
jgi:hypothetical protein